MILYEIKTIESYSRKKIPAITLRQINPITHEIINEYAMPEVGTSLKDKFGQIFKIKKHLGNLLLLANNYGGKFPSGKYLEI